MLQKNTFNLVQQNIADVVVKTEADSSISDHQNGHTSPAQSESSSCENTQQSEKSGEDEQTTKCNGTGKKAISKRKASGETVSIF